MKMAASPESQWKRAPQSPAPSRRLVIAPAQPDRHRPHQQRPHPRSNSKALPVRGASLFPAQSSSPERSSVWPPAPTPVLDGLSGTLDQGGNMRPLFRIDLGLSAVQNAERLASADLA